MKTELSIRVRKDGNDLEQIVKIVAAHNSSKVNINNEVIASYILARKALYEALYNHLKMVTDGNTLNISEDDGTTWYISISENEIHELNEPVVNESEKQDNEVLN